MFHAVAADGGLGASGRDSAHLLRRCDHRVVDTVAGMRELHSRQEALVKPYLVHNALR